MADSTAFAARMIDALALSDPDLDTSVGTEPRKIIDMLAEQLAEVDATQDLLAYRFDIDSKRGADLDSFVQMFGFSRFPARRAYGTVTLYRNSPAPQAIHIPAGTQVSTTEIDAVVFQTVASAWLARGTTSVEIPIQAVIGGAAGNLPPQAISMLINGVEDLSANTSNLAATVGGMDEESDEALIARFKRTVFRSLAGTEDMYLGVALESDGAASVSPTQANVLGVTSVWREQVQIGSDGTAQSSIPPDNVKYVFADSFVVGPDIEAGQLFAWGVHYDVDTNVMPPKIIGHDLEVGQVVDVEFEYTSSASRNDPGAGISNRIDVWVNGEDAVEAGEAFTLITGKTFTSVVGDPLYNGNFVRLNTPGTTPTVGNVFSQLTYGPILSFPDVISVAGVEYRERQDFFIVHDDTAFGWGPTSRFGIEWVVAPANGTQVGVSYFYNKIPRSVEARIRRWRLVGTDARAHAAKAARLVIHLAVMYVKGVSVTRVNQEIFQALVTLLEVKPFAAVVQTSDVLHAVKAVTGVDAARLLTADDDGTLYGIQEVTATGTLVKNWAQGGRAIDVLLRDDQVPVLHDVRIVQRAQNTIHGAL